MIVKKIIKAIHFWKMIQEIKQSKICSMNKIFPYIIVFNLSYLHGLVFAFSIFSSASIKEGFEKMLYTSKIFFDQKFSIP